MEETSHKTPHNVRIHLYEMSTTDKSIETESRLVVARGWERRMGVTAHGDWVSSGGDGNVLGLNRVGGCITL